MRIIPTPLLCFSREYFEITPHALCVAYNFDPSIDTTPEKKKKNSGRTAKYAGEKGPLGKEGGKTLIMRLL